MSKAGCIEASVSKRLGLPSLRPLAALGQEQEPGSARSEAGGQGGLGKMTRRKREIHGLTNERDFPHLVELTFPPGGFRSVFLEIDAFHRDREFQFAAAGIDTRSSNSIFDSVSQTPPLRMHSAIASVASA